MYNTHLGQEAEGDPVSGLLARADETAAKVAEVKDRIADLRQSQTCPACGAPCGREDKFCRRCGGAL